MLIRSHSERLEKSRQNNANILTFLFNETWSSAPILGRVINLTTSGTYKKLNKLVQKGLLKRHYIRELGMSIWGITKEGLLEAWECGAPVVNRSVFEPSKISPFFIHHHLDLQNARLNAEARSWQEWKPDKLLSKGLKKRPDAVSLNSQRQRIAIELERTIKTLKRYETIWALFLMDIKNGLYDYIHYVVPDEKMKRALERIFSLIQSVPVNGQRIKIENKHRLKFEIHLLEDWPVT